MDDLQDIYKARKEQMALRRRKTSRDSLNDEDQEETELIKIRRRAQRPSFNDNSEEEQKGNHSNLFPIFNNR